MDGWLPIEGVFDVVARHCNHGIVIAVRTKLRVQSGWTGVRPFGGQIGPVVTCSLQSQLT